MHHDTRAQSRYFVTLSLMTVSLIALLFSVFGFGCGQQTVTICTSDADCAPWVCNPQGKCVSPGSDGGLNKDGQQVGTEPSPNQEQPNITPDRNTPPTDGTPPTDRGTPIPDEPPPPPCKDGETRACYTGPAGTETRAPCKPGTQRCIGGKWEAACNGQVLPPQELCNNKDDDCDGEVDESFPENVCTKGRAKGPCREGKPICEKGVLSCQAVYTAKPEVCGNGFDDDCDGIVDGPPCTCPAGQSRACYTGASGCTFSAGNFQCKGGCKAGTQTCSADGKAGECTGQALPQSETCNNRDDNCDGNVDETFPQQNKACSVPGERGECQRGTYGCYRGNIVCIGPKPSKEICGDKKDNDCDGNIDETCSGACTHGKTRPCYTASFGCTKSGDTYACKGTCKPGVETCSSGEWGPCTGEIVAKAEVCGDNKDDDCDGIPDNGCTACSAGQSRACYTGPTGTLNVGNCKAGTQSCSGGKWGACSGDVKPAAETCNKRDDDCDGIIDDGVCGECQPGQTRPCYSGPAGTSGKGPCKGGTQSCQLDKTWGYCAGQVLPQQEVCDKIDNDCDGSVDESGVCGTCNAGATRACYSGPSGTNGVGRCRGGTQTCGTNRQWGSCSGQILPVAELCNNQDDNCDGKIDEALTRACSNNCGTGAETCQNGVWFGCSAQASTEICNGKDDDCDGQTDETFPGLNKPCNAGSGVGNCALGLTICQNGREVCKQNTALSYDICGDKLDNDCDGKTDESCGPAYNFALIQGNGQFRLQRGATGPKTPDGTPVSPRSDKGVYRFFLTGVHAYQFGVPIAVPLSSTPRIVTWSRGGLPSLNYEMLAFRTRDLQGNLVDTDLAIVAAQGGVYSRITDSGGLLHSYPSASAMSVTRVSTGRYRVTTSLYKSANTPVYLSLFGETWYGHVSYVRLTTPANSFEIHVRDSKGGYADATCAFWIPEVNQAIWATVRNGAITSQASESKLAISNAGGISTLTSPANVIYNKTIGILSQENSSFSLINGLDTSSNQLRAYQYKLTAQGNGASSTAQLVPGFSVLIVH